MKKISLLLSSLGASLIIPLSALAQPIPPNVRSDLSIKDIFVNMTKFLDSSIPVLMVLATVVFMWGVVRYVTAGGDEQRIGQGRKLIFWGIIALFVIVAMWGIVLLLSGTLFGTQSPPPIPAPNLIPFI